MNNCYSCTTCKSADKPLEGYIAGLPMETSHHRVEGQSVKCGFGLQGVCCRLCSNGPCLAIGRLEMVATQLAEALKVDIPDLPLVLSAAQWLEEQALADGAFGLALGLPLHLGLPPFITGSSLVTQVLTEDMRELTGGQVIVNGDAKASADILERIIEDKRKALNI